MTKIGPQLIEATAQLPDAFCIGSLPPRVQETHLAMAAPADNPEVDGSRLPQWESLREALSRDGCQVETLPAPKMPGLVHLSSRVLLGEDGAGTQLCIPARLESPAARQEATLAASFFLEQGYRISQVIPDGIAFAAGADAVWHPGRRLLWGGYGSGTSSKAYPFLAILFQAPVFALELVDPDFPRLNSCFWALDESTALIYEAAFSPPSLELLRTCFPSVVPVSRQEAVDGALGGLSLPGKRALLHKGSAGVCELLRMLGYSVREIALGSFLGSGGFVSSLVVRYRS